ncbi:branched-chain amino acid ABC transporter permease [Rhizobium sp. L1K21]|uniref:branched-chain amino acid ABC transporter permease n=1 Tax=Rhizobium sp. L1K21 TaxID=2954933 RepID=UPI0020939B9C|nr:branched-chain amino acid ABC transporter permease [Rhizobium sp. L1K21]MCO6186032.1 branched-chain amino acid ABC transporter permease [Rhizobium sp. L1K21]
MENLLNAFILLVNYIVIPATAYGCQLAIGALGATLIFAVLRFSNFAHGELMSFGAMITVLATWALQSAGISIAPLSTALLALPVGIIGAVAMTLLTDRWVYRYYRRQRSHNVIFMIVSIGVMFFMAGLIRFIIGPDDQNFDDGVRFLINAREFRQWTGLEEGLAIRSSQAITLVITIICVAALFWFLERTRTGKSMRAFADNEDLALLSGINPERVVAIAWIIAAALATIAGTLYGMDKSYKPFVFQQLLLPIFASAIVGGFGSPIGAVAGGFIIAFSEVIVTYAYKKFFTYILPEQLAPDGLLQLLATEYKFAVSFIILVLVLLIKPTGIFGGRSS